MSPPTYFTMLFVMGIVWGGFGFLLRLALSKETGKRRAGEDEAS